MLSRPWVLECVIWTHRRRLWSERSRWDRVECWVRWKQATRTRTRTECQRGTITRSDLFCFLLKLTRSDLDNTKNHFINLNAILNFIYSIVFWLLIFFFGRRLLNVLLLIKIICFTSNGLILLRCTYLHVACRFNLYNWNKLTFHLFSNTNV